MRFVHAFHLVKHGPTFYRGNPILDVTLAATHTYLKRFLRNRFVREDTNPYASTALNKAGQRAACRFNLARRNQPVFGALQTVLAKTHFMAARSNTTQAALHDFTELRSFRL